MNKASELMLGDYLRYKTNFPDKALQGKVVNVVGVEGRVSVRTIDDGKYHESEHPNWLAPLPLTEEILQKNFPTPEEIVWWPLKDGSFRVEMQDDTHLIIGKYNHVHELQHALRLFGKEGKIEL